MATEWQNPPDADVILRTPEGKELRAHQLVLSLSSPVFRDMFSSPLPTETEPPKLAIVDVHDSPEALEIFLQIIYPVPNSPINDLDTLTSVLKLADKYDAKAALDVYKDYLPLTRDDLPPVELYAILCVCCREREAEAAARRVPLASLSSLPGPMLQLMTVDHYHRLVAFVVTRENAMREIVARHQRTIMAEANGRIRCYDVLHRSHPVTMVVAIRNAFEDNPWLRVTDVPVAVPNTPLLQYPCGGTCKSFLDTLQEKAESLLVELVEMAKTLPWEG